jgi:3-oxoacyl-[acyl-carrier protein] reductase
VGGSSKGIGEAVARQLAACGASVTLLARNETNLQALLRDLDSGSGQSHGYLLVDYNDHEAYKAIITKFFETHTIDILVNNTQGPPAGNALDKKVGDYQGAFDLLFKNAVLSTELALGHMRSGRWGRIINISSITVKEPVSELVLSNSIRAALVSWAKSLALEVAGDGITVNNTLTGYFDTDRIVQLNAKKAETLGLAPEEVRAGMEARVPAKRLGKPSEYGYLVAFLASDQAGFITGANIPIDGGLLRSL